MFSCLDPGGARVNKEQPLGHEVHGVESTLKRIGRNIHGLRVFLENESESQSVMSDILRPHRLYSPWSSAGQNTRVGSLSLLQGILPTQGSNPGLPHCRQILYQLSHKASPHSQERPSFSSGTKVLEEIFY